MKLKRLTLKNIRSYKEEEIVFPDGSILLAGDIGSGKTSILLAIEYALFGLQPGQKGLSLLRNSANQGSVVLEMEVGNNSIIIERKLKRNTNSVTNEYSAITTNGKKFEASLTEIKTKIIDCIGYPLEFVKKNNLLYRYTVYTPQEQMKQIIMEDEETRLNILRHILGIDKYKIIRENLVILLNFLKEESKLLQGETKALDEDKIKLEERKTRIKILEKNIIEKNKFLELKVKCRRDIEIESTKLSSKIKEKEYLERELEKTRIMIANKYENIATINNELQELEKIISDVKEAFNEQEYKIALEKLREKNQIIESLTTSYSNLISEINSLEKHKKDNLLKRERIFKIDICPSCLQDVPESHKHNILNETEKAISEIKHRTSAIEVEILDTTKKLAKEKSEKQNLEELKSALEILRTKTEYLEKVRKRKQYIIKLNETLEKDIRLLGKHAEAFRLKIIELSRFESMFKQKEAELDLSLEEEKRAEISLAETKKETELTKLEIQDFENSIKTKENIKKQLSNLLELQDWLSSSFLELIEFTERTVLVKLRYEFSRMFSKWFQMLVPQESLNVRLNEAFSPIILHNDLEMEYSFLSGGERTAIALAYRLALNQTINSIFSKIKTKEIIILDEPTDGFSDAQLDKIRDVLQELNASQLIIVSHEQKIESFVENVIKIKKIGDTSCFERSNEDVHGTKPKALNTLKLS